MAPDYMLRLHVFGIMHQMVIGNIIIIKGTATYKYDSKTMYIIVNVYGLAI